jgi:protease I
MAVANKTVAIVVHNYFEQAEFTEPLQSLKDAGAEVHVISASGERQLQGLNHVDKADTFQADLLLEEADPAAYDALVLPGGAINADHLRMVAEAQEWVRTALQAGKPLAVICHAPWVLVSSGVAKGRRLTSYYTIQDDMKNAGADWIDEEVVIDGNLVTSRNPDDLPAFCSALIGML